MVYFPFANFPAESRLKEKKKKYLYRRRDRVKGNFTGERSTFHPLSRFGSGFQALGGR
jgi:hypothetical protein